MASSINRYNPIIPLLIQAETVMLEIRLRCLGEKGAGVDWNGRILGSVNLIADNPHYRSQVPKTE